MQTDDGVSDVVLLGGEKASPRGAEHQPGPHAACLAAPGISGGGLGPRRQAGWVGRARVSGVAQGKAGTLLRFVLGSHLAREMLPWETLSSETPEADRPGLPWARQAAQNKTTPPKHPDCTWA